MNDTERRDDETDRPWWWCNRARVSLQRAFFCFFWARPVSLVLFRSAFLRYLFRCCWVYCPRSLRGCARDVQQWYGGWMPASLSTQATCAASYAQSRVLVSTENSFPALLCPTPGLAPSLRPLPLPRKQQQTKTKSGTCPSSLPSSVALSLPTRARLPPAMAESRKGAVAARP